MMIRPGVDMMEALRLTRQGRLEEAMAVLRGALPASEASVKCEADEGAAPVRHGATLDGDRKRLDSAAYVCRFRSYATRRHWLATSVEARRISGSLAQGRL
jgi:hypothetical protein